MEKLVSVLIPTRGRFDVLLKAIKSVIDTANKIESVEIMLRFDEDDDSSLDRLDELPTDLVDINVIVGKRHGYISLHKYINEMCEQAKGKFLFLFDDDCKIVTKKWDDIIRKYIGQIVCLNPNQDGSGKGGNLFPIINREIYELLGHFSLSTHSDSWHQIVSRRAGIEVKVKDFIIMHDRKQEYFSDTNRKEILDDTRGRWTDLDKSRTYDADQIKKHLLNKKPEKPKKPEKSKK